MVKTTLKLASKTLKNEPTSNSKNTIPKLLEFQLSIPGRRNCPGETIAWMEILYYFTEILKNFEVTFPPGVEPEFEIINGLVARLAPQPLCFIPRKDVS